MKKKGVLHMTNIIILDDQESHINDIENQVRSLAIDDLHIRKYQTSSRQRLSNGRRPYRTCISIRRYTADWISTPNRPRASFQ